MKIPAIYYYVPPCPECGSRKTGRYVSRSITQEDTNYMIKESLKHGELVRIRNPVPINNAYCEECGHEWPQIIRARLWDTEKVEEETCARGTFEKYEQFCIENPKRNMLQRFMGVISGVKGEKHGI